MSDAIRTARQLISRNQGRLAILVLLLVCIYFIVIFGEQAWRANRLEAEIAQQRASIDAIRRENGALATRAEQMNSPAYYDYVEQVARRDFGMARPGETVVIVPRQSPAAAPTPVATPAPSVDKQNWQLWIDAIFDQNDS